MKKQLYILHIYKVSGDHTTENFHGTFSQVEKLAQKRFVFNVYKVKVFNPPGPVRPNDPNDPNLVYELV